MLHYKVITYSLWWLTMPNATILYLTLVTIKNCVVHLHMHAYSLLDQKAAPTQIEEEEEEKLEQKIMRS